ncbi:MAG: hypothetical protein SGILL_006976, partial [Bacillariaceae sp.]
ENSEYKWKHDKTVIGALEVEAEPVLDLHAEMKEHTIMGYEDDLTKCIELWKEHNLRHSFIQAFEGIAPQTRCCGLVEDYDETIKHNMPQLNDGWAKDVNDKYMAKEGYRITAFIWRWSNPTGKAETVIPMIRFHSLKIKRAK